MVNTPLHPYLPLFERTFDMFIYVVQTTYPEIFSLLRICSGSLSNTPGLQNNIIMTFY